MSLLRKAIGAGAIATVPGEGYRFVWPVVEGDGEPATGPASTAPELRRLSVIVLPFVEPGAAAEQDYFADADAATGAVVWSEVFEIATEGVGHLRRELVARLANALNLQLIAAEASRIAAEDAAHPAAIDLVMRAWACGSGRQARTDSLALCDRALQIQPGFAPALVARAQSLAHLAHGWPVPDYPALVARAEDDITRALAQDSLDARSHQVLGFVRRLQFRFDAAFSALDQGLALNPNDSQALAWRDSSGDPATRAAGVGWVRGFAGPMEAGWRPGMTRRRRPKKDESRRRCQRPTDRSRLRRQIQARQAAGFRRVRGVMGKEKGRLKSLSSATGCAAAFVTQSVSQFAQSVIVEDDAGCVMAFVPAHRSVKLAPISAGYPTLMAAPQLR